MHVIATFQNSTNKKTSKTKSDVSERNSYTYKHNNGESTQACDNHVQLCPVTTKQILSELDAIRHVSWHSVKYLPASLQDICASSAPCESTSRRIEPSSHLTCLDCGCEISAITQSHSLLCCNKITKPCSRLKYCPPVAAVSNTQKNTKKPT